MSDAQWMQSVSVMISFVGLLFAALQIRNATKQRQLESMLKIYDVNRQLLTLGFSNPELFPILDDSNETDPLLERYYLQLWLNQFAILHTFLERAMFGADFEESMERDVVDFLRMENMRRHWRKYGTFYPTSFKKYINEIIQKTEPPATAAQMNETALGI